MSDDVNDRWKTVQNLAAAKKMILDSPQVFSPDDLRWLPLQGRKTILDFGCGVGRNIPALLALAPEAHIIGYDSPNMRRLAEEYLGSEQYGKIDWITPPPENLKRVTYDLILAVIVFQHIEEQELRNILSILRDQLSDDGKLGINSRGWSDDHRKSVWKIILDYFVAAPESHLNLDAAVGNNHQQVVFSRKE